MSSVPKLTERSMDLDRARDLVTRAQRLGASDADVLFVEGDEFSVTVRRGEVEQLHGARSRRLGLRVFVGGQVATGATSDTTPGTLERLVSDLVANARAMGTDPAAGLPSQADVATSPPDLDLDDDIFERLSMDDRIALARRAEEAATGADPRISNSDGSTFAFDAAHRIYAATNGFAGEYPSTTYSLVSRPLAAENGEMQRDYYYTVARHFADLEAPDAVGAEAARRTLRRLGAQKPATGEVPVVFSPETASRLLGAIGSAASGAALYNRASFLLDRLGESIAAPIVEIRDDPLEVRGLGSRPFDGEGVATRSQAIVSGGALQTYLLDTYSARRLDARSSGSCRRSTEGSPSAGPHQMRMTPGEHSPEDIIATIDNGLYVTSLIGHGMNLVTGDFSQGAAGLWIRGGELAESVEECTVAARLQDIFMNIEMIGSDLELKRTVSAPTLKIARLMVAGQ
ncbi:MAG: metallopeptidase TldD-related protein [Planctomycetota bacterium]